MLLKNIKLINKLNIIAFSVLLSNLSYANTASQDEIEQLRAEVKELRTLLEQSLAKNAETKPIHSTVTATQVQSNTPIQPEAKSEVKPESSQSVALTTNGAALKVYGFARMDGIYDVKTSAGEFVDVSAQPFTGSTDKTQFTAATSRLGLDLKKETDLGTINAKLEGDFWGRNGTNRGNFRMRHAYFSLDNWLIGQTWSPFSAQETAPDMIDFNVITSGSFRRSPQLRYTAPVSESTKLIVALEEPSANANYPDISTKLEHKFAQGTVNVRGVLTQVRDTTSKDKELGYGAAISGLYALTPQFSTSGQLIYLNGANKYSDTGSSTYVVDTNNDIALNEMLGAYVAATYRFNPQWRSTLAYGWSQFEDHNDFAKHANADTANKALQQTTFNIIYNPVANVSLGGEYNWGEREVMSGDVAKLSRINFMARYNF